MTVQLTFLDSPRYQDFSLWSLALFIVPLLCVAWHLELPRSYLKYRWLSASHTHHLSGKPHSSDTPNGDLNGVPSKRERDPSDDIWEHEIEVPFDVGEVRVSRIFVHPIKSCRGTSVPEVRYTPEGLENDRKWCIVDARTHTVVTAREVSKMVLVTPRIMPDTSSPHGGQLLVEFPEDSRCETFAVPLNPTEDALRDWEIISDCALWGQLVDGYVCARLPASSSSSASPSEILSTYLERPVLLVMKGPRPRACPPTEAFPELSATAVFQDGYPLLVASEESLQAVTAKVQEAARREKGEEGWVGGMDRTRWHDGEIEMERFRPNIVFAGAGVPFAEDMWREIVTGPAPIADPSGAPPSQTITLVSKCTRCLLPNVDTRAGTRDAAVPYKVLMKFRRGKDPTKAGKACFGCNGLYGGEGTVRVGDWVAVRTWAGAGGV
ncbi:hypothetical protein CERSUDRAFT_120106 [Gelatoporia subvermispora B]|uniref:MOSC domain-containing protein n=1 Tax=Ceriporiopsis subvermispora (strain B) TaxID=914234 RepID=M2QYY7_CERS8|nr:hypothetical protein CERSUDRAFT_120106 [Gelatoporia subvermispora B]